ncbi:MAG: hypothetical protein AB1435_04770 [Chloroflexota bacterium]
MSDHENTIPPADDAPPAVPLPGAGDNGRPPQDKGQPEDLGPRLERLGGEPAPDITPEEFARLQQAGQIHIDPRGRVRTTARDELDAGVSLRKRRAWYSA